MASPSIEKTPVNDSPGWDLAASRSHWPRRPLPGLVMALITGLALGAFLVHGSPIGAMAGSVVLVVAALAGHRHPRSSLFLHAAVVLTGMAWMQLELGQPDRHDLRRQMAPRQYVDVTGWVNNLPQADGVDARGRTIWRFDFQVESHGRGARAVPSSGLLRVRLAATNDAPHAVMYGDRWRLRGVFTRPDRPVLRGQGVAGHLQARMEQATRLEGTAGHPLVALSYHLRNRAFERLGWGLPPDEPSVALTRALLLGYRQDVPRPVYDAFARTGTLHILALSGLHVGILILLLTVLVRAVGVNQPYWVLFFLPFLLIYTIGTGAAASTLRASIMAFVYFSAFLFRRKPDAPTSLALAALLILLVNPQQLFHYGFLLSFVVVAGLIVLIPPLSALLHKVNEEDPWADPENRWWSGARNGWKMVLDLFTVSLAAWLASLPMIASAFHVISPMALAVNLVLVPLAFVILLTTCLALGASLFFAALASVFNHANTLFCGMLLEVVDFTSRVPGSHVYVKAWPWYLMAGWYALLVVWLAGSRRMRWSAAAGLVVLMTYSMGERGWSNQVQAVAIPGGDAVVLLIDGPGRHAVLFDTGSAYHSRALVDQLRRRGISSLDQIWMSRATTDAYGGLYELLQSMRVGDVFIPDAPAGQRAFHIQRARWSSRLGADALRHWPPHRHFEAGDLVYRILYPGPDDFYRNARASALMVHVSRGHRSLLFMGQSGLAMEARAGGMPLDWNADTLVVGSCNAIDSLSGPWLELVRPRRLVLSTRAFDRLPQGAGPLIDRLRNSGEWEVLLLDGPEPVEWSL